MTRPTTLAPDLLQSALRSAGELGTPFWLYEAGQIRARAAQLKPFDCVRYAQKANSNTHILRLLREEGLQTRRHQESPEEGMV